MSDEISNHVSIAVHGEGNPSFMFEYNARDEGCVRDAWKQVTTHNKVTAEKVRAIYTVWEPSVGDLSFLATNLPGVPVHHRFARPTPDGWEASIGEARRAERQAVMDHAYGGDEQDDDDDSDILPMLWTLSGPQAEALVDVPHQIVVVGHLAVALAIVPRSVEDEVEMHLLTHEVFRDIEDLTFTEALVDACDELTVGMRIDVADSGPAGRLLSVLRPGSVAAGALVLPDFHEQMSHVLEAEQVVVGLSSHTHLLLAAHGSHRVAEIETAVREDPRRGLGLIPSMWMLEKSGLTLLREWP